MERSWAPIDKPEVVDAQEKWLRDYGDDMKQYLLPQSYVNFPNRDLPDWQHAYYAESPRKAALPQIQIRRRKPLQVSPEHSAAGRPETVWLITGG